MKRMKITKACLLSAMMMGVMATTLSAMTVVPTPNKVEAIEKEWTQLETKNGVTCYYKIDQVGTCNNAILLRFVNNSKTDVTVNFSVDMIEEVTISRKITLKAGQTLDP